VRDGLLLAALAAYSAIYVVLMVRTACLRCSEPLRNTALSWGSKRQPAPCCPHCGLSIDQEVREPRSLQEKSSMR
jgi:predicted amidophosphoribosyltransferase